jgi:peptidoglycan hydrolase CwlO-like protein
MKKVVENIIQIKNPDGYHLFPKTKASAVYMGDGKTLGNIDPNAQENKIESILVNGKELPVEGKAVNINISETTGGVSDYVLLENKPKINNIELAGNKTTIDLGLASSSEVKRLNTKIENSEVEINTINTQITMLNDQLTTTTENANKALEEIEQTSALIENVNNDLNTEITRALKTEQSLDETKQNKLVAENGIVIREDSNSDNTVIALDNEYVTVPFFNTQLESLSSAIIQDLDGLQENKQNNLTAGFGIKLENDIISLDVESPEEESGSGSGGGSAFPTLQLKTDDLKTTNSLYFDGDKVDRVKVNSKDMVLTGDNLKYFIKSDGEYTEIKKIEYDMCQFSAPDLDIGYISLNPGFTQTLNFNTYVIDENTVIEDNFFVEVPRDFDNKLTPLYNYRTGSEMYSFEVWTDEFVEDMTGLGSTAMPRKALLQAYSMDEMSLARVALIDCSYLFGKPTRPYLAVFIRGLNGYWRTIVAYNFYNSIPDSVVGNGIGRYTIGLQHWVWEQIQRNTLKGMDLDKLSKSNKNSIDSIKTTLDALDTKTSNNTKDITALQTRVDQLNSELSTSLANIEQRLLTIENNVSSMLVRLEALEARNS